MTGLKIQKLMLLLKVLFLYMKIPFYWSEIDIESERVVLEL